MNRFSTVRALLRPPARFALLLLVALAGWSSSASGQDRAPTLLAPNAIIVNTEANTSFTVLAGDPDGDAIASLTMAPLAAGMSFTANASNTSATFDWTPTLSQAGTYNPTVTAANALSSFLIVNISVRASTDPQPVVTTPALVSVAEGTPISFHVTVSDPDGDPITELRAISPLPAGAVFIVGASFTSGTFTWTPSFTQAGSYAITFLAVSNEGGTGTTFFMIDDVPRPPVVVAPTTMNACVGRPNNLVISASDPDGEAITSLTAAPLPAGATFTTNASNTSGTLSWSPTSGQPPATVTFTASNALSGSATTTIFPTICDAAPVVTAPSTISGSEGTVINFVVTATSPDGETITTLTASGLPAGATFTFSATMTSGSFSWTPAFTQAGTYRVTFTAVTASSQVGSASTNITIANVDRRPVVNGPSLVSHICQDPAPILFTVSASDPDGEAIASFTAFPIPSGATFTTNATNTSGTFQWTPPLFQVGSFPITFTASNMLSGSFTTTILLQCSDRAPVVTAPASASGSVGTLLSFTVLAADPDGDAIVGLSATPLPSGASFTSNAAHTSGTFTWTPTACGSTRVTFTASNALSGSASTDIVICNDGSPIVTAPPTVSASSGVPLSFLVTAEDQSGDPITSLTVALLPSGATFTTNATNTSGTFAWTPSAAQGGTFSITFTAIAGGQQASATTVITVLQGNQPPIARAGGPYVGTPNVPIEFNGTASTDPEGVTLTYLWDFGDGTTGVGTTPSHSYTTFGVYQVVLTVSDGLLSGSDATTASIVDHLQIEILTRNKSRRIRLGSGPDSKTWCAQVETQPGVFAPEDIDPSSIRLSFNGVEIAAVPSKQGTVTDLDDDGAPEVTACFTMGDLGSLGFPQGTGTYLLTISAALTSGVTLSGTLSIEVQNGSGGSGVARMSPNPLNPAGVLSFETRGTGRLTVRIFDLSGRLVRTLVEEPSARPGVHEVRIDGRDAAGAPLPSGVYFYQIRSVDGSTRGRFTILK